MFKQMTLKQKIEYLWDYYKWIPILTIIIGGIIFSWGKNIIANSSAGDAYCLILNDLENDKLVERIKSGFETYSGEEKIKINVDNGFPFTYMEEHGINWPDDVSTMKFTALMGSGNADVAIADFESFLWAGYKGFAMPLDEVLPEEMLSELEPYFIYYDEDEEDSVDAVLCALDISGTDVYKGCEKKYDNAVVYVPTWTEHPEIAVEFIKYLFGMEN